jgi:hypothetical protein
LGGRKGFDDVTGEQTVDKSTKTTGSLRLSCGSEAEGQDGSMRHLMKAPGSVSVKLGRELRLGVIDSILATGRVIQGVRNGFGCGVGVGSFINGLRREKCEDVLDRRQQCRQS